MASRGKLRIYLGAAPGVGKTYAMLDEGRRRRDRGTGVLVGFVETHGRAHTAEMLDGLEVLPRRAVSYRGTDFTELDVAGVIRRAPRVVLIDELAHTNVPGSGNEKRWQDVEQILDAGIDVISTVNVQHLESVNDVIEQITGIPQRETVPDEVVRRADAIELVDMSPQALRRRMAHGNIYPPEKIDAALGNYFREGNLTALRELALLWLADKVDEQLDRYRADHDITGTWEARERVVVALTGGPEGDTLIRRAARIAARTKGADLLAVHVATGDGLAGPRAADLARLRVLVESLGGTYHEVVGSEVPQALLEFARGVNATQLVLGASRRGRLAQLVSQGVGVTTTALSGPIDVHLVTHEEIGRAGRSRRAPGAISWRRRLAGFALAAALLPLVTWLLGPGRGDRLPSALVVFMAVVVAIALAGGLYPALAAAVVGDLLLNYYFTPPVLRWTIADPRNILAIVGFVLVAAGVSAVVDLAARRTGQAARASADAEVLFTLSGDVLRGQYALARLLDRLRETFALTSVTLLERPPGVGLTPDRQRDPARWRCVASVGEPPCASPDEGDAEIPVGEDLTLVLRGRTLQASERRVVEAFAAQAAAALRQERLAEEAEQARPVVEADRLRTALLNAVSHDLRSPLASAKAAVDSLGDTSVRWSPEEHDELVDTARLSLDRLGTLVANLLDMSRLRAGMTGVAGQPVRLDEVLPLAADELSLTSRDLVIQLPGELPAVRADPTLLQRVVVNLVANARRFSPADRPVLVTASALGDTVELRVVDRGPGIPADHYDQVFLPFQRLGDTDNSTGVGLGLALSRGFAEAMRGTLTPEETPGGGLTMVLTLPADQSGA